MLKMTLTRRVPSASCWGEMGEAAQRWVAAKLEQAVKPFSCVYRKAISYGIVLLSAEMPRMDFLKSTCDLATPPPRVF